MMRRLSPILFYLLLGSLAAASEPTAARSSSDLDARKYRFSILPRSLQSRPWMDFNILTEMTAEGRKLTPASPENPAYYVGQAGKFVQTGSTTYATEKAPPVDDLERAMKSSLASGGYLPVTETGPKPTLVIVFNYGSHSIDPDVSTMTPAGPPPSSDTPEPPEPMPPVTAEELLPIIAHDVALQKDLIERAALIGGMTFAEKLAVALKEEVANMNMNYDSGGDAMPVSPNPASPFQQLLSSNDKMRYLVEEAFHTCYFVMASAYDYDALGKGQRRLLWRTKMTIDAQGVNMKETLPPLIASAGPYFGRPMAEMTVVSKRISREGYVKIGTPTVVEDKPKPASPAPLTPPQK